MKKFYAAIDLKSFYASVECVERGLDPMTTNLVVADQMRTDGTICLAVSPSLKKLGLSGRARLFEVKKRARLFKVETGRELEYIVAPPRMRKYLDYSRKIYNECYLKFAAAEDVYRYSIDEVFIDISSYLKFSGKTAEEYTSEIVQEIFKRTGLVATAGVGTNLYLAKVAMDILAKHAEPNENNVRLAFLDEAKFRRELWAHKPLTDFWGIGRQTARKLMKFDLYTFGDLARVAIRDEEFFYKMFGVDAEIFIDHLFGIEPTEMKDIKNYKVKSNSLSNGQVLGEAVDITTGRLLTREMADELALTLTERGLETNLLTLDLFYDKSTLVGSSHGSNHPRDKEGGTIFTASARELAERTVELYDRIVKRDALVKRIYVGFSNVRSSAKAEGEQKSLFDGGAKEREKEEKLSRAVVEIQKRFGKDAILKAMNFEEGANLRMRNHQIGGHHE